VTITLLSQNVTVTRDSPCQRRSEHISKIKRCLMLFCFFNLRGISENGLEAVGRLRRDHGGVVGNVVIVLQMFGLLFLLVRGLYRNELECRSDILKI